MTSLFPGNRYRVSIKALLAAAGYGRRLSPLTDIWPKCLMPVKKKPILEYWIDQVLEAGIDEILVNIHHFPDVVISFLQRDKFKNIVRWVREEELLGTAGTVKKNIDFFYGSDILLVHADNFCLANLDSFIQSHKSKPKECIMTMMTFVTDSPKSCGIVTTDRQGVVTDFFEKVDFPPSNIANGAVYLLDKEFLDWLDLQNNVYDFSFDVIPNFLGRIKTWKNNDLHIDIGTIKNLIKAQHFNDLLKDNTFQIDHDEWYSTFLENPIHELLENTQTCDE